MRWSDEPKDILDQWSWGQKRDWTGQIWDETLLPFLNGCEKKKWKEIEEETAGEDRRNKSYELDTICKEAFERLCFLKLDELDEIFRFRLGNKPRFYGFRIQHLFYALWWDADHMICPSDIQNRNKRRRK